MHVMDYCVKGRLKWLDLQIAVWKDFKNVFFNEKCEKQNIMFNTEYCQKLKI